MLSRPVSTHPNAPVGKLVEETGTGYVELLGRGGEQTSFNYFAKLLELLYQPDEVRLQFHLEQGDAERPNVWVQVRRLRYLTTDDETRVSLPLESFNPERVRTGAPGSPDEFKRQLARLSRVTQDKLPSAKWIGLTVDFSYQAAAEKMRKVLYRFQSIGTRANTQRNEIARTLFGGMRPRFGRAQDPSFTFDGQDLAAATGFSPQLKTAMRDLAGVEATLSRELDYGIAETGKNVIIGVVDFGCDFAHASVRKEWKSKILALWDQNAGPEPPYPGPPIATAEEACVEIGGGVVQVRIWPRLQEKPNRASACRLAGAMSGGS